MIYTSSYNNCKTNNYLTYSISGDRGNSVQYKGSCYRSLAPKLSFWNIWHENPNNLTEEDNNRYYIEEYYKQVLMGLDPRDVYNDINNSILLCYEDEGFCHRHIVAAWLEVTLGIEVPEIRVDYNKISTLDRPSYIKEYLLEVMKKNNIKKRSLR